MRICEVENCDNKHQANGYCSKHYFQIKKYGKIPERTMRTPNEIIEKDGYYEIVLYKMSQKEAGRALIDKDDLDKIVGNKWCICRGYGVSIIDGKMRKMHQIVIGKAPDGLEIDHINRNKLDNRKKNLRFCTRSENNRNKDISGLMNFYKRRTLLTV